jgi:zinc transporter 1/2/3
MTSVAAAQTGAQTASEALIQAWSTTAPIGEAAAGLSLADFSRLLGAALEEQMVHKAGEYSVVAEAEGGGSHGHDDHGHDDEEEEEGRTVVTAEALFASALAGGGDPSATELDADALSRALTSMTDCMVAEGCLVDWGGPGTGIDSVLEDEDDGGVASPSAGLRLGLAAVILALGYLPGLAPALLASALETRRSRALLSLLSMFSGGVFLAAGLTHLLPEAVESEGAIAWGSGPEYPVATTAATLGFLLVFFVERVLFSTQDLACPAPCPEDACREAADEQGPCGGVVTSRDRNHDHDDAEKGVVGADFPARRTNVAVVVASPGRPSSEASSDAPRNSLGKALLLGASDSLHPHSATVLGRACHLAAARRSALALLAALVVHATLAGVALGLADSRSAVVATFVAIVAHKMFAAISLGTRFVVEGASLPELCLWMIPFALATPLGVGIGVAVDGGASPLALSLLEGLSAGTFLYIGAFEVLAHEFGAHHHAAACADTGPTGHLLTHAGCSHEAAQCGRDGAALPGSDAPAVVEAGHEACGDHRDHGDEGHSSHHQSHHRETVAKAAAVVTTVAPHDHSHSHSSDALTRRMRAQLYLSFLLGCVVVFLVNLVPHPEH